MSNLSAIYRYVGVEPNYFKLPYTGWGVEAKYRVGVEANTGWGCGEP
jgi:hypothetical protein